MNAADRRRGPVDINIIEPDVGKNCAAGGKNELTDQVPDPESRGRESLWLIALKAGRFNTAPGETG
jgi:hypothetical protein